MTSAADAPISLDLDVFPEADPVVDRLHLFLRRLVGPRRARALRRAFDDIIEKYGLEKIKTIGDAYMCAGGIPTKNEDHPLKIVKASFEIMEFVKARNNRRHALGLPPWDLRIGIHVGPLVAGVVGRKKYAYDIWGSTVNIASRMENNGEPGHVNVSSAIFELVKDRYQCTYRGKIYAKNIGEIDMYFIEKELSEKQEIRPLVDEPATVPTSV